ncbi:hypothetical protein [Actinokineospora enzanensis]|uniref:hypothetical protein n=1 Tax=Actinokineospora enzanensis TaxID=155975 RepID=UPI0003A3ABB1|nr:hypothetical protein [Actinokineospora enzanensis]
MSSEPTVLVAERYAYGATVAAVVIAGFWHVGYDLPMTIANYDVYAHPWAAVLAWLVELAVGAAAAADVLHSGSTHWAWPLAVPLLGVAGLMVLATPDATILQPAGWAWGSIGWVAVILFWQRPFWHLMVFQVLNAAVLGTSMGVLGISDHINVARAIMVLFGAVTMQLAFAFGAPGLHAAARWAARISAARAKATARRAAAEAVAAARAQRYQELHRSTSALLAELAGGADPADPDVRYRCLAGAARLRRLLAETDDVPDPLLHELRAGADVAERRGVVVSLAVVGTVPDLPVDLRRALTEAPIMALSTARGTARVTVVAGDGEVAIGVVADAPEVAITTRPGIRLTQDREGERLWLETVWQAAR